MKSLIFLNIPQRRSLCWVRGPTHLILCTHGSGYYAHEWDLGITNEDPYIHAWDLRTTPHVGVIGAGQVVHRPSRMRL
jgi:hypothetical protein